MSRDIYSNVSTAQSLAPAARTATANGTGVDLTGYDAARVIIDCGTWTDGTFTFEVQDSSDDSTYTAVADAYLLGTEPVVDAGAEDDQIYEVGYIGTQKYLRVRVVVTASPATGMVFGASIVRGNPTSEVR